MGAIDIYIDIYPWGSIMPTEQLLLRLPQDLVRQFRLSIPQRQRSAFVQGLLEKALLVRDDDADPLYQAALAVEQDDRLAAEMAEWDETMVADGLDDPIVRK